jgi:hypothetical protein
VTKSDEELRELLQAATARGNRKDCLDADALSAAAEGGASEAALEHLGSCADCADEYRTLRELRSWSETLAPVAVDERASQWWLGAIAAAALLVAAGLGVWSLQLMQRTRDLQSRNVALQQLQKDAAAASERARAQLAARFETENQRLQAELLQPQINVPIVDLEGAAVLRGERSTAVQRVELPKGTRLFNVVLYLPDETPAQRYDVEIVRDSDVIWQGSDLRRSAYGTFTLALPTRLLPEGRYQIYLRAHRGTETGTHPYDFQIVYR